MKIKIFYILRCKGEGVINKRENVDANSFTIPQIGSKMITDNKIWRVGDVQYDYDKVEVNIYTKCALKDLEEIKAKRTKEGK